MVWRPRTPGLQLSSLKGWHCWPHTARPVTAPNSVPGPSPTVLQWPPAPPLTPDFTPPSLSGRLPPPPPFLWPWHLQGLSPTPGRVRGSPRVRAVLLVRGRKGSLPSTLAGVGGALLRAAEVLPTPAGRPGWGSPGSGQDLDMVTSPSPLGEGVSTAPQEAGDWCYLGR